MAHGLKAIQDLHASEMTRLVFRRSKTHACGHHDEPRIVVDVDNARLDEIDAVQVLFEAGARFDAAPCSVCARGKEEEDALPVPVNTDFSEVLGIDYDEEEETA